MEEIAQKNNGLGLLWQKDPDSNFPFTEIRSARRRFVFRPELKGQVPAEVHLHPEHAGLVERLPDDMQSFVVVFNDKLPRLHIVLSGRATPQLLLKVDENSPDESMEGIDA